LATRAGKTSITWSGPVPMVTVAEPEVARQVLSNKFGHFQKVGFGQLQRLLHSGVSTHEGDKWARHRRIIKPAFHLDKLKVIDDDDQQLAESVRVKNCGTPRSGIFNVNSGHAAGLRLVLR